MISHWIAVIGLFVVVAGGMAFAWPHRKKQKVAFGADLTGPGSAIEGADHHHSSGDGLSADD